MGNGGDGVRVFVCPFCGRKFVGLKALVFHVRMNHFFVFDEDSGLYVCPACGFKAGYRGLLKHIAFHADDDTKHAVLVLAFIGSQGLWSRRRARALIFRR